MISLPLFVSIAIGKAVAFLIQLTGSGGTAAPGLIALKVCPELVGKLAGQLDKNILITGTNGKTTTARMIASILKEAGIKHLHNRVGSNLLRGVASTLLRNSTIFGRLKKNHWGLWETDEAAFPIIVKQVKPQFVLITNLFRDQLDRYGEIDTVAKKWQKALLSLPSTATVILNADDATVASLGKNLKAKVSFFGLADPQLPDREPDHTSDATACPFCMSTLDFYACYVGHMGAYSCSNCGRIQPKKDFSLIKSHRGELTIRTPQNEINFKNPLPGIYNLYNFTAAVSLASILKIKKDLIIKTLSSFKPAFGRVETIRVGEKTLNIFLVKNPTGFNEVIETLIQKKEKLTCLIVINDLIADGTDVSWLWDVHFEKLMPHFKKVLVSGIRAFDMNLRLKYTINSKRVDKELSRVRLYLNLNDALNQLLKENDKQLFILPTYTAMLETRKILNKMGLVHSSWQD